jgi:hypothetical protein
MPYCSKPYKPVQFNDEDEVEAFKRDVARYKACIDDFVAEQEEAIGQHRSAANDAIDEWNSYVKWELR